MDPDQTPKSKATSSFTPIRHLGLRRCRNKKNVSSSGAKDDNSSPLAYQSPAPTTTDAITPLRHRSANLPQSAITLPSTLNHLDATAAAATTDSRCSSAGVIVRRRSRLSHINLPYTAPKRLDFVGAITSTETPVNARDQPTADDVPAALSPDQELDRLRQLLASETRALTVAQQKAHEADRLRSAIAMWETGFRAAFNELQTIATPPHNTAEALFSILNIPPDLIELE